MKRIICSLLFFLLLLTGVALAANDSITNATSISTGSTYSSNLTSSSDKDFFKFTLPSDGYVNVSFSHGYVDGSGTYWRLYLINSNSDEYLRVDYTGKSEAVNDSHYVGLPAGTYYLKIDSYGFSNLTYNFKVNYTKSNVWETEFNDGISTADPISTGVNYSGSLTNTYDKDFFKFTLPSDGYVNVSFSHGYVDGSGTYWRLYLINSNSDEYLRVNYTGKSEAVNNSHYVGLPAGTYYLKIDSYGFSNLKYNFKVNYTKSNVWETEFNDTMETADQIKTGMTYTGSLTNSSDTDFYCFTLSKSGYVNVSFEHGYVDDSSTYWRLYLINSNSDEFLKKNYSGKTIIADTSNDIYLSAGKYYIKIVDYGFSNLNYSFSVLSDNDSKINFILPSSLIMIETEAFKGVPAKKVQIPSTTSYAKDAFDNGVEIVR